MQILLADINEDKYRNEIIVKIRICTADHMVKIALEDGQLWARFSLWLWKSTKMYHWKCIIQGIPNKLSVLMDELVFTSLQQYFSHFEMMEGWTWKALSLCNEAPFRFEKNLAPSRIRTRDPMIRSRER